MKVQRLSEDDLKELRKMAKRHYLISHLLISYETIFAHACDPNSDVLEFKPAIAAAMKHYEKHLETQA